MITVYSGFCPFLIIPFFVAIRKPPHRLSLLHLKSEGNPRGLLQLAKLCNPAKISRYPFFYLFILPIFDKSNTMMESQFGEKIRDSEANIAFVFGSSRLEMDTGSAEQNRKGLQLNRDRYPPLPIFSKPMWWIVDHWLSDQIYAVGEGWGNYTKPFQVTEEKTTLKRVNGNNGTTPLH